MQMHNATPLKIILALCGLALLIPGLILLIDPAGFTDGNGIDLGDNVNLFNDYRSLGGILIGTGLLTLIGIVYARMAFTSTAVAAIVLATVAAGRIYSIIVDGQPVSRLVIVTIIEAILAALAIYALITHTENEAVTHPDKQPA